MTETIHEKVKKSLRYSVLDGTFNAIKVGFGESFFQAFATLLKASDFQVGLIGSLPQAVGSVVQLWSQKFIDLFDSRKKFVLIGVFLELLMYIPIMLIYFFGTFKAVYLIIFTCLYWAFGSIAIPAWSSWMGDLVPEHHRGRYFGMRNKICGLASFFAMLLGGYVLQLFADGFVMRYVGFCSIFLLAFISRIISWFYLTKKYEPEYSIFPTLEFSFIDFLKKAKFRNYGLFVIYNAVMNFAVYIAAPYIAGYMLYELKMGYLDFTIVTATAVLVKYLMMPVWGKACDRYGTRKVLALAGFLMPLVILLWTFSTNFWWLIFVQIYSGFAWAGFEIASFSFVFDTTTTQKRALCVAYANVLNGVAFILGALSGGIFIKYNIFPFSGYLFVFGLSMIIRYAASIFFIPKLKEVRNVHHISYQGLLMYIIEASPTVGFFHHITSFRQKKRG
jgi:MFS family permease